MENRFKVQTVGHSYIIVCTLTNKRCDYEIGSWIDAANLCSTMNAADRATQEREVNRFFV
jgi:hypothetical protein